MEPRVDLADFLQRFSTKVLWHFTGYNKEDQSAFEVLLSITKNQSLRISDHKQPIKMPSQNHRWGYGCSCMCDIPFKDLRIHILRYGRFGIALHKPNAIKFGHFNPVLYMHKDHYLFNRAEELIQQIEILSHSHAQLSQSLENFLTLLGTYVKSGDLLSEIHLDTKKDEDQNNNFYYEREWRSAQEWKFQVNDVAAIMMPQAYIVNFREQLSGNFPSTSIISTEMIEAL